MESSEGGGLRGLGLPALDRRLARQRLGDGIGRAISGWQPRARVAYGGPRVRRLRLLPTGVGEPRDIELGKLRPRWRAGFPIPATSRPRARRHVGVRFYLVDIMTASISRSARPASTTWDAPAPRGDFIAPSFRGRPSSSIRLRGGERPALTLPHRAGSLTAGPATATRSSCTAPVSPGPDLPARSRHRRAQALARADAARPDRDLSASRACI